MKNKVNFPLMALRTAILVAAFFACGCFQPMMASTTTSTSAPTSNGAATTASRPAYSKDSDKLVATLMVIASSFKDKSPNSPTGPMVSCIVGALHQAGRSQYINDDVSPASATTSAPAGSIQLTDDEYGFMYANTTRILDLCESVLQDRAKFGSDPIYKASIEIIEVIAKECPVALARMDAAGYLAERALAGHTDDVAYEKLAVITESLFKYVLSQPCSEKSPEDVNTYAIRYFAMRKFINYVCAMKAMAMEKPDKDTLIKYFEELKKTAETAKAANAKNPEAVEAYDTLLNDISTIISQKDEMFQQLVDMVQIRTLVRDFSAAAWLGDAGEIEKRMTKRSAQAIKASGQKPLEWLFGIKPRSPIRITKVGNVEVGQQQDRVTVEYQTTDDGFDHSKSIPVTRVDGKWLIGEKD